MTSTPEQHRGYLLGFLTEFDAINHNFVSHIAKGYGSGNS